LVETKTCIKFATQIRNKRTIVLVDKDFFHRYTDIATILSDPVKRVLWRTTTPTSFLLAGVFLYVQKSRSENILKAVRKGFVQSGNTELKVWGGTAAMLRWADTKSFHSIGERS
jgi:hypothetical protein